MEEEHLVLWLEGCRSMDYGSMKALAFACGEHHRICWLNVCGIPIFQKGA